MDNDGREKGKRKLQLDGIAWHSMALQFHSGGVLPRVFQIDD